MVPWLLEKWRHNLSFWCFFWIITPKFTELESVAGSELLNWDKLTGSSRDQSILAHFLTTEWDSKGLTFWDWPRTALYLQVAQPLEHFRRAFGFHKPVMPPTQEGEMSDQQSLLRAMHAHLLPYGHHWQCCETISQLCETRTHPVSLPWGQEVRMLEKRWNWLTIGDASAVCQVQGQGDT